MGVQPQLMGPGQGHGKMQAPGSLTPKPQLNKLNRPDLDRKGSATETEMQELPRLQANINAQIEQKLQLGLPLCSKFDPLNFPVSESSVGDSQSVVQTQLSVRSFSPPSQ